MIPWRELREAVSFSRGHPEGHVFHGPCDGLSGVYDHVELTNDQVPPKTTARVVAIYTWELRSLSVYEA